MTEMSSRGEVKGGRKPDLAVLQLAVESIPSYLRGDDHFYLEHSDITGHPYTSLFKVSPCSKLPHQIRPWDRYMPAQLPPSS
jgi:hypothetical protein